MNRALALLGAFVATTGALCAQGSDDCANAQVIAGLGPFAFDNTAATKDGPNDCDGQPARKDVWYRWTAPANGGYILSTCALTTLLTRLVVYDFQACPVSTPPLMCGADGCGGGSQARISFPTVAGQDYLIRLGSKNFGQSGTGMFEFIFDPCWQLNDDQFEENDTCDQAAPISDGFWPGLLSRKADQDWFSIDVVDGATVQIDIFFTHAIGDLDMVLYNACGGGTLGVGGSGSDDETISWTNNTGACVTTKLTVTFFPPDPAECNNYDLQVQGSSPVGTCSGGSDIGTNYCTPSVPNSTGQSATISAFGSDMVADNDVTLTADLLPANQFGMFLNSMTQGFIQNPGGSQGNLCLKGSIGRYNRPGEIKGSGAGGTISLVLDLTDTPQPTGSVSILAGETWNFQTWYRDVGGNSNFTDGIEIMFL